MGIGQQLGDNYGLDDDQVAAARRRAMLQTGLSLVGSAGTQGFRGIPRALLGGVGTFDEEAQRELEAIKEREEERRKREAERLAEERTVQLMEKSEYDLERTQEADAEARESAEQAARRAEGYREMLKGTPYEAEAPFADLARLEELVDLLRAGETPTKPHMVGPGGTRAIDPVTGEIIYDIPPTERPSAGGGAGMQGPGMSTEENRIRDQINQEVEDEVMKLRRRHLERVGPADMNTPEIPAEPFPDEMERRAIESVMSRYRPEQIPPALRDALLGPKEVRQSRDVAAISMDLLQRGYSDLVERLEQDPNALALVLELLERGYTKEQIIAELTGG